MTKTKTRAVIFGYLILCIGMVLGIVRIENLVQENRKLEHNQAKRSREAIAFFCEANDSLAAITSIEIDLLSLEPHTIYREISLNALRGYRQDLLNKSICHPKALP